MSSTAISTFLAYNPPVVTTHCGEVYCSSNLDYFLINCTTCSQEFNLLSCNLFIKHIKECMPPKVSDPGDQNTANQEISSYTIENLLKDALKNNNIDDAQSTDNHIDPLLSLKLELVKEKDETPELTDEQDVEYLSDYQDEDDLTIDKVVRRRTIEGIIDEYKKHPVLWDVSQGKTTSRAVKKHHYKQIRKAVNSKFRTNYTDIELRTQILNLRCGYRRVLKKKEKFQKLFTEASMRFNPQLWYFDKISFIEGSVDDTEIELANDGETDQDGQPKVEVSDNDESSDSTNEPARRETKKEKRERPDCKILSEPNIITDIIAQYKKYPFLWDQTASLYNDKYARKDAFRQITSFINKKFNKNVTDKEMRQQIVNLRSGYRRAQRKKHRANYRISLWYYDELSFIDRKSDQISEEPIDEKSNIDATTEEKTEDIPNEALDETQNYDIMDQQSEDDDDCDDIAGDSASARRKKDKKIILSLIEEYKRHPCLWDNYLYKTSNRFHRYDANKEISEAINTKFNTNFTDTEIRNKLVQLRSSYRRVLRNKEAFEKKHANAKRKFHPQLWYFDKMTFIGATESDFSVSRRKKRKTKPGDKQEQNDNAMEVDSDDGDDDSNVDMDFLPEDDVSEPEEPSEDEEPKSNGKSITKNRELLTSIIEEYKKLPCLWAVQHYTNDNLARRKAYGKLAKIINDKFKTQFTFKDLSQEIIKLRSTYKRMLRRKHEHPDGEFKTKIWYADMLSFIEKKPGEMPDDSQEGLVDRPNSANVDDPPAETNSPQNHASDDDEIYQRRSKIKNKEHVFEIIELYQSAPILWDTKHHQHMLRTERRKAIDKIIATLSQEHDCHLTVEEFRYQIRFLRDSYFRAVRHDIAGKQGDLGSKYALKPFFYDRMSFLAPFADKNPLTVPELQVSAEPEPNENFKVLVENKQLMIDFIELYKAHGCLWDQKHKDRNSTSAHSDAYDKIVNMFLQHDIIFTKEQVLSAINFLHSTVVSTQKKFEFYDTNNASAPPIWFYEHLQFLGRIPRIKDKYCNHCDQHFRTLAAYEKHKIEIAGDYPYKCTVCNAGFVSRSKYAYHQITHKEPHKCDQCGFQAFDRHNFNVHMRRHKGIHPFRCEHCDKGFVTSTELNRHLRMHTGEKPFICDICGKPLAANSEFHQHMKRHRNQRDHKCELCGSAFYTPKTLRDHMASHSSERQHVCEVCGAAFKRKKTLHQHKALHLEKKKHECKICGKLFAQKAGVYSHMKSHGLMVGS